MATTRSGARYGGRQYQKNVLGSGLKDGAIWLALNFRYALVWLISLGGRLDKLPERSEKPLVAALAFGWGLISIAGLVFAQYGWFLWWVALAIVAAYIVGAYLLFMEQPGANLILGVAMVADLVLIDLDGFRGVVAQSIKLLIFSLFLLICVQDWRHIVTLPKQRKTK